MHKSATKCNKTQSKWCINKHEASKIIDTFETYQLAGGSSMSAYLDKKCVLSWVIFFHVIDGYFACFWNRPRNLNLLRLKTLLTLWVPKSDSQNNKRLLSRFFSSPWLLANPSLKFQLDKVEGRYWRVGPRCQIIRKGNVCTLFDLFCSPWLLHTWLLFSNPLVKFELDIW
jgi:hypothetical protein